MRGINQRFIDDLLSGELAFFLKEVQEKRELLTLEIRNNYLNIYYRGGNLLKITQQKRGYRFHFNPSYCLNKSNDEHYAMLSLMDQKSANDYIMHFPLMMSEMDNWLEAHPKPEREYQHKLIYNNPSIIDIEYQINRTGKDNNAKGMRIDMIIVIGDTMLIVENKYGNAAINGSAGLAKHYADICRVLDNEAIHSELANSMQNISNAKYQLGLISYPPEPIVLEKTEIFFLLANYKEKGHRLHNEIAAMTYTYPAKLLILGSNETVINYKKSQDLFSYGLATKKSLG